MHENLIVIFSNQRTGKEMDIEIPLSITADELIKSLNHALGLEMDTENIEKCFLRTENPIALLRGDKLLKEYHLRTGTRICFD